MKNRSINNLVKFLSAFEVMGIFIIIFVYGLYKMAYFAWVENRNREILFLSLFIIIYFLAITGPVIGVKYRLPIEPIMTLFFAYAASNLLRNKIHRKSAS